MKLKTKTHNIDPVWQSYNDNDIEKFRQLIKNGVDINKSGEGGRSLIEHILLDYTQIDKNIKFFDELINDNINFKSIIDQKFLLSMAVCNSHDKAVHFIKKLLKFNVGINSFGVGTFRDMVIDRNFIGEKIYSPPIFQSVLMFSICDKFYLYDLLLKKNPDLECCNEFGETILNYLINSHNYNIIENCNFYNLISKMIKQGANPTQKNLEGCNSLHALCKATKISSDYNKLFNLFLKQGCDINLFDSSGITPLIYSIIFKNPQAIEILLKNGADIDKHGKYNMPAIFWAGYKGYYDLFCILYNNNASLTHIMYSGDSILHVMLNNKSYKKSFYTKILDKNPELLSVKNNDGETPIDIARKIKNKKIKSSLISLMEKY